MQYLQERLPDRPEGLGLRYGEEEQKVVAALASGLWPGPQ